MAKFLIRATTNLCKLERTTTNSFRAFNSIIAITGQRCLTKDSIYSQGTLTIPPLLAKNAPNIVLAPNRFLHTDKTLDQYGKYESEGNFRSRDGRHEDEENFKSHDGRYENEENHRSRGGRYENEDNFRSRDRGYDNEENSRNRDWDFGENLEERDWGNIKLVRLNKNVFTPNDAAGKTNQDVLAFREQNRISFGRGEESVSIPDPIMEFEDAGFPEDILGKLKGLGFSNPMPIQAQGWPIVMSGRDLIGIGETGSGKTLGYMLPALMHIVNHPERNRSKQAKSRGPLALVLAPTRELAQQIQNVAIQFGKGKNRIRSVALFGGANKGPQIRALEEGVDLVVATPGRLIDLLSSGITSLESCSYMVLDEADRMLDMGFEPQIRKIVSQIRPDRQMLMWSATWPDDVRELAEDFLEAAHSEKAEQYVHLNIGSTELQAAPSIQQNIEVITGENFASTKQRRLLEFLETSRKKDASGTGDSGRMLIFAQTKKDVDFLERIIRREGHNATSIHGGKTQMQRDSVLSRFRSGRTPILIATDVAARGLDVNDIECVINFEFPNSIEDYVHRIGRTGRAGKSGYAFTFLGENDGKIASKLVQLLQKAEQNIPAELEDLVRRYGGRSQSKGFHQREQRSFGQRQQSPFRQRQSEDYSEKPRYTRDFVRRNKKYDLNYED